MNSEPRILVVDDEPKVAFFFQQHLELGGNGYTAKAVNSGASALQELQKNHYDLMITDLSMPKMDGLELLRRVREVSPKTKTILVTAYGSEEVWEEARRLNISQSLSKPIRIPDLLEAVQSTLEKGTTKSAERQGILTLTGENYELLAEKLEELRVDVGAQAAIIADNTGRVMVNTGNADQFEISTTLALLGSTMAAASVLSEQLAYQDEVHLSYFEGPPYDIYAANLGKDFFLTIVQNRQSGGSRIGVVWLYTRRIIKHLAELLRDGGVEQSALLEEGFAQSVQDELDELLVEADPVPTAVSHEPLVVMARPAVVPAPPPVILHQRIEGILEKISERTGLQIEHQIDILHDPLPMPVAKLLTQTVTATLKNTLQHGKAGNANISFSNSDGVTFRGLITDDGIGLEKWSRPTLGSLHDLQKRYEVLGGRLDIFGFPDKGTTVTLQIPMENNE